MKRNHIQIGDTRLLTFSLEEDWDKKKLSNALIDNIAAFAGGADELSKGMDKFYLKIRGYRDESIIPENMHCTACPNNSSYRKYDDYNGLREENKQPVLVLESDFVDFREYGIVGSYYTDGPQEGDNMDNIELWADKLTWTRWLRKKTGFRA
jgi:hypothetical protein